MFHRILIANRGEIAVRIIRTCSEMGIETVAVYSTEDANAHHVQLATQAVCVGPPKAADSYLNMPALLSAAALRESGAGHLQILLDFGAEGIIRSEGAYNAAPLDPAGDA